MDANIKMLQLNEWTEKKTQTNARHARRTVSERSGKWARVFVLFIRRSLLCMCVSVCIKQDSWWAVRQMYWCVLGMYKYGDAVFWFVLNRFSSYAYTHIHTHQPIQIGIAAYNFSDIHLSCSCSCSVCVCVCLWQFIHFIHFEFHFDSFLFQSHMKTQSS